MWHEEITLNWVWGGLILMEGTGYVIDLQCIQFLINYPLGIVFLIFCENDHEAEDFGGLALNLWHVEILVGMFDPIILGEDDKETTHFGHTQQNFIKKKYEITKTT